MGKILFILPSFGGGGAERVAQLILENLDRKKFEPMIVLFQDMVQYKLPSDIPLICLNKKSRYDFFKLIWRLAKIIEKEKPQLILSFLTYANFISILARKIARVKPSLLISEHNNITFALEHSRLPKIKRQLVRWLYSKSNLIISVSHGVVIDLIENFSMPKNKTKVIYNPINITRIETQRGEFIDHSWFTPKTLPIIIAAGRLTRQKGYSYLLRAFSLVKKKAQCRLVILGEGALREELESQTKELGISQEVIFLGFQQNPFKFIARSDIFVLSSLWEGFGLVIIEAMDCGVPVISTRCPFGPDEIITDGVNGLLVPPADESALAEAILKLLKDDSLRKRLSQAGQQRTRDFSVDKIIAQYERLFLETIKA